MALLQRGDRVATNPDVTTDDDAVMGRAQVDELLAARRRFEARQAAAAETTVLAPDDTTVIGPRPRTSMLATLSLVFGVGSALGVLTGLLAGPGVAVGLLAVVLGIGGVMATGRRHVAGKGDALLGIALGLGAVVVGVLALTGLLPWLSGETNTVERARDWLLAYVPWLFPGS